MGKMLQEESKRDNLVYENFGIPCNYNDNVHLVVHDTFTYLGSPPHKYEVIGSAGSRYVPDTTTR